MPEIWVNVLMDGPNGPVMVPSLESMPLVILNTGPLAWEPIKPKQERD